MTTPSTMELLNAACRHLGPGECYLEVGTWRGATLIGALLGNDAVGYAIDNDAMIEHNGDQQQSRDVWRRNVKRHGVASRAHYVDASTPGVYEHNPTEGMPVGLFFYDGDKSSDDAAYDSLSGALILLADEAIIVIDDANDMHIRAAVSRLMARYPKNAYKIIDFPTPGNGWASWWNGIMVIAWDGRKQ
jgi:predicted O-methyltransferase YrrM